MIRHVVLLTFVADYEVYRDHPAHQAVIRQRIGPIRERRAAIQFEH